MKANKTIFNIGQVESTHIRATRDDSHDWTGHGNHERKLQKLEIDSDLEGRLLKLEFESSFGSENDASVDFKCDTYPYHLNPDFDLQIAIKVKI